LDQSVICLSVCLSVCHAGGCLICHVQTQTVGSVKTCKTALLHIAPPLMEPS
jgi:hypothetical protein